MQVRAVAKQIRISPRKMGEVAALVRRRSVSDALVILEHTPRRAADHLRRVISSAAANAQNNHKLVVDQLQINSVLVSPGLIVRRWKPGSRGHIDARDHRSVHVTVVVEDKSKEATTTKATAKLASTKPKSTAKENK